MKSYKLFLFLIVFSPYFIQAQQVIVKGNAKSYAGDVLYLNCYEDMISYKEKELSHCLVGQNGDFQFKFNIGETIMSFIHLNVFKGILYIEPGKVYEIVLPQKVQKLPEDELNPFFEESEFFIRQLNGDGKELTEVIKSFNRQLDNHTNKYFTLFKGKLNKSVTDTIIQTIDSNFTAISNRFFNNYKTYNYLSLRMMAYERNRQKIIEEAFISKPVLYQNPAYMDLFNQLFANYLANLSKTEKGNLVPYHLIKEKSLKNLKKDLASDSLLVDDQLQDMIICKSLFENYYKDDYPHESIVFMLDSIRIAAQAKENRIIAKNILAKITTLMLSFPAPDFELPDKNGKLKSLSAWKGKFVYLNFINPGSYTSQQELEVLRQMASKNYEMLDIVTICACKDLQEMQKLIKDKGYTWTFLDYAKKQDLLKQYNVKVYPTYYLINPEGKLVMSPAFPPTEPTFEARYADMLRAWKKELEQRKTKGLQH